MKYLIKVWENEDLRNSGISDIIENNIEDMEEAITKAKKIMEENNCASLEVQTDNEKNTIYYSGSGEEKYFYNVPLHNISEKMKFITEMYFIENGLKNLMDYGSDRDIMTMPSLSNLYKDLIDKLGIRVNDIQTEDVSDGKYKTTVEFYNGSGIIVDTSARNGTKIVSENLKSIYEEFENTEAIDMNKYTSIIIIKPSINEEEKIKIINKYKNLLEKLSSRVVDVEDLGKKRLAYEVCKCKEGIYINFDFYGKTEGISELERYYRLDDDIIKFATFKQEQEQEFADSEDMEDENMEM